MHVPGAAGEGATMDQRQFSTGGLARTLGVSPTTVRKWEGLGLVPRATRLEGSDRRVYAIDDLDSLRQRIERRRRRGEGAPSAA